MKLIALLILTGGYLNLSAQKPMQYLKTKASISGIATGTDAAGRTVPSANASFRVVEGALYEGQLPVSSFSTDDKGNFYLELPVGTYSIVEEDRPEVFTPKKSTAKEKWDNACRKKLWQAPLLVLHVQSTASQRITLDKQPPGDELCLKKSAPNGK